LGTLVQERTLKPYIAGMCGRFTRNYTWAEIHRLYMLTSVPLNLQPRFNICPTTTVDVVILGEGIRSLVPMRWGIIPDWWKKSLKEMRLATFNARAETIADKPMFRESFKRRRCLMPASGYYEWHTTPEGKQPYYFTRRDGRTMTIAVIQDGWVIPQSREALRSCAMVITEPNKFVAEVHDRMPVTRHE
jgi:putative SOS response-associated peptidase YedK